MSDVKNQLSVATPVSKEENGLYGFDKVTVSRDTYSI
jgi:hypothetical protein